MEALRYSIVVGNYSSEGFVVSRNVLPQVDRRFYWSTERGVVDSGVEASDDISLNQFLYSGAGRVRAQPNNGAKFAIG